MASARSGCPKNNQPIHLRLSSSAGDHLMEIFLRLWPVSLVATEKKNGTIRREKAEAIKGSHSSWAAHSWELQIRLKSRVTISFVGVLQHSVILLRGQLLRVQSRYRTRHPWPRFFSRVFRFASIQNIQLLARRKATTLQFSTANAWILSTEGKAPLSSRRCKDGRYYFVGFIVS